MNILTINLALSTLVFWIAAKLYVLPNLQDYEARAILLPILLLHSLRRLGLMFLTSGAPILAFRHSLPTRPPTAILLQLSWQ